MFSRAVRREMSAAHDPALPFRKLAPLMCAADTQNPRTTAVTFILAGHRLVTVRYDAPKPFVLVENKLARSCQPGITGEMVLMELLDAVIDRNADILERAGSDMDNISHDIFEPEGAARTGHAKRYSAIWSAVACKLLQACGDPLQVVAERLYAVLSKPPKFQNPARPQGQPVSIAGQWQAEMQYDRGRAIHTLVFEQDGANLVGTHFGEYVSGDLSGSAGSQPETANRGAPNELPRPASAAETSSCEMTATRGACCACRARISHSPVQDPAGSVASFSMTRRSWLARKCA